MWGLKTDAYITRCLQTYGEYCEAETELFRQVVKSGMTVVEAGANIGVHSVMLAGPARPAVCWRSSRDSGRSSYSAPI